MKRPIRLGLSFIAAILVAAAPIVTLPADARDPTPTPTPSPTTTPGVAGTPTATKGPELFRSVAPAVTGPTLPPGFRDRVVISGLTEPTVVQFADDGRIFVGEKSGKIKLFDSLADTTPTTVADLNAEVYNFWDRGLLGLALDPDFPATPHLYALYTYNVGPFATQPLPGTELGASDDCPTPPGPSTDGCPATGRLARLVLDTNGQMTSKQIVLRDWCQQVAWHSIGTVLFGPDGKLYAGGGEGAWSSVDYGQYGGTLGSPPPTEQNP
ncbi:MAG TPA: PQQ-dependent sugar dehydrogenase, partial [Candidatus Limnocylindrales bacterium]|nr:PQQ-dependent sugar dehydrogenase [Candidatus Limnocylindrales bacterium]